MNAYLEAYAFVIANGYGAEIDWQESRSLDDVDETMFLRECAWVILSAGMSERVIRGRWKGISNAFLDWSSADAVSRDRNNCVARAVAVFAHVGKIDAIATVCTKVAEVGIRTIMKELNARGPSYLQSLPFIGPVTSLHLAKNLGADVVKPDRHLVRIAAAAGLNDPGELCEWIAKWTGDRLATIDIVLWRYATLVPNYMHQFIPQRRAA